MPREFVVWIEAREKHKLSHLHIQMAKELGLNPRKFGSLGANKHEPWKGPLNEFIEDIYFKRFRRATPERLLTIEEMFRETQKRKAKKFGQEPISGMADLNNEHM